MSVSDSAPKQPCAWHTMNLACGYAKTEEVRETQRLGAGTFLKKPYTLQSLGLALEEELNRK
jgi:hypothetical protein